MQRSKVGNRLTITEHDAVAQSSNRSTPRIAKVLGRETRAGVETVWLDRLVHTGEEFDGWEVSGAVSSVCRRNIAAGNGGANAHSVDHVQVLHAANDE